MSNDPIADILTRVRNAKDAKHRYVDSELSKARLEIIKILKDQGYIDSFLVDNDKKRMRIFLKYKNRRSVIQGLKRVSKPGLRRYVGHGSIPRVFNGLGIAILSTSQGILDGESARQKKLGGELWCTIW